MGTEGGDPISRYDAHHKNDEVQRTEQMLPKVILLSKRKDEKEIKKKLGDQNRSRDHTCYATGLRNRTTSFEMFYILYLQKKKKEKKDEKNAESSKKRD